MTCFGSYESPLACDRFHDLPMACQEGGVGEGGGEGVSGGGEWRLVGGGVGGLG